MDRKMIDGLMGFAIGDAMGVPTEFCMRDKLMEHPITSMIGFGSHEMPAGTWSDDTSMTLATMDAIISDEDIILKTIMENFLIWVNEAKYTASDVVFDIGRTVLRALKTYSDLECNPEDAGGKDEMDNGNGSLMRMLPIAYYTFYRKSSERKLIETISSVSSLTHGHEISILGCYLYVKFTHYLLAGLDKFEAYENLKKLNLSKFGKDSVNRYSRILENNIHELSLRDISSSAFVVDTLESVFWILFNTDNFKHAIIGAINMGNDTDTIGAIVGSLAGIYYGYSSIPYCWINKLIRSGNIIDMAKKFDNVVKEQ